MPPLIIVCRELRFVILLFQPHKKENWKRGAKFFKQWGTYSFNLTYAGIFAIIVLNVRTLFLLLLLLLLLLYLSLNLLG